MDKNKHLPVVIELKKVEAKKNTFKQIKEYLEYIDKKTKYPKPALGLVISKGFNKEFRKCLEETKVISHLNIKDLGFE